MKAPQKLTPSIIPLPHQHSWIEIDIPSTMHRHRYVLRTEGSQKRRRTRPRRKTSWHTVERGSPRRRSPEVNQAKSMADNNTSKSWVIIPSQNKVVVLTVVTTNGCVCSSVSSRWGCGAKDLAYCDGWQTAGRYITAIFRFGVCVFPNGLLLPTNSPSMSSSLWRRSEEYECQTPDWSWCCFLWAVSLMSVPVYAIHTEADRALNKPLIMLIDSTVGPTYMENLHIYWQPLGTGPLLKQSYL